MNMNSYPTDTQKFLEELIKRKVISKSSLKDQMLINHLVTQKFDEDYIDSMSHDRVKKMSLDTQA